MSRGFGAGRDVPVSAVQRDREAYLRARSRRSTAIAVASTLAFAALGYLAITQSPGWPRVQASFFDLEVARAALPRVLRGLWVNLQLLVVCEVLVLLVGLAVAAVRTLRGPVFLPVRLPFEVAPLFRAWLDEHFPDRADKVMNIIRSMRGGRDNYPNWFTRMQGQGPWAELLRVRFEIAVKKHGLNREKKKLRCDLFVPPQGPQLRLL